MQKNGYKITHAHNAYVYTVPPKTVRKLLKQRVRWSHGFIKNAFDYKGMFFQKKYGNLGMIILPMAALSIISVTFVASVTVLNIIKNLINQYVKFRTVGFDSNWNLWNFDWFYINTEIIALVGLVVALGSVSMILMSKRMSEGKFDLGMDLIYYLGLYMFIAPIWIIRAGFNAVFSIKTSWR